MATTKKPVNSIPVGRFKAHCLTIMKDIHERREPLLVTKRGKPLVHVVPVDDMVTPRLFGAMRDSVRYHADIISADLSDWPEDGPKHGPEND